jgi:2OG-Fe(II) oxygenase superfamily
MQPEVVKASAEIEELGKQEQKTMEERLKAWYTIEKPTWSSCEEVIPGSGIWVYRDVLPKDLNIIERLESVLSDKDNRYTYQEAMVGYGIKMPEYRDCVDFKYKKSDIIHDISPSGLALQSLADDVNYRQLQAVKDYTRRYNIGELRYWEATNYVRYGEGQHFQEHHDHGYSYNCVVSLVSFPNDDYEGGELSFRLQNATIKPKAGETYIFPSNFMYPHRAMPVRSGVKYSMVTMLDYSDKFHNPKFYEETGS